MHGCCFAPSLRLRVRTRRPDRTIVGIRRISSFLFGPAPWFLSGSSSLAREQDRDKFGTPFPTCFRLPLMCRLHGYCSPPAESLFGTTSLGPAARRRQEALVRNVARRSLQVCIRMSILLGWFAAGTPFLLRPVVSAARDVAD